MKKQRFSTDKRDGRGVSENNAAKFILAVRATLRRRVGWQVSMSDRSGDPEFSFRDDGAEVYRPENAIEVRSQFLDGVRSPEDALRFFERFGPFEIDPTNSRPRPVRWSQLKRAQADFEAALLNPVVPPEIYDSTFRTPITLKLHFHPLTPDGSEGAYATDPTSHSPYSDALAPCQDVAEAIRTSVFLSRLRGAKWKRCARPDCDRIFECVTRRDKIYCSPDCAHKAAMRAFISRSKESETVKAAKSGRARKAAKERKRP